MSLGVSPFQIKTLKANIIAIANAVRAALNRFGTDLFRSVVDVVGDSTETPCDNVLALDLKLAIAKAIRVNKYWRNTPQSSSYSTREDNRPYCVRWNERNISNA